MDTETRRPVRMPPLAALALFMASCAGHARDDRVIYVAEPSVFFYGGYYHGRYYERGYYRYYDDRGYYEYYGPTQPAPAPAPSPAPGATVSPSPSVGIGPVAVPGPVRLRRKR